MIGIGGDEMLHVIPVDIQAECHKCFSTNFSLLKQCEKAVCPLSNYRRLIRRYHRVLEELEKEKKQIMNELYVIAKQMRK